MFLLKWSGNVQYLSWIAFHTVVVKYVIKNIVAAFISGGLYVSSESKEDHIHFLVFTDVCGNRTYGVVAQYYQSMQVCYLTHSPIKTY